VRGRSVDFPAEMPYPNRMQVTIHEARNQLSRLITAAQRGEEVVILRRDKPVARIVAERPALTGRKLGFLAHVPAQLEGFFDRELEDAIAREFDAAAGGEEPDQPSQQTG